MRESGDPETQNRRWALWIDLDPCFREDDKVLADLPLILERGIASDHG
jgi:hypothetical protein